MLKPGDCVTLDFAGVQGVKRRPGIVVSSDLYDRERPDVFVGLLTTNLAAAKASTDYLLRDWASTGLHSASAFRCFFVTAESSAVRKIGHLSDRDWQAVRDRLNLAFG